MRYTRPGCCAAARARANGRLAMPASASAALRRSNPTPCGAPRGAPFDRRPSRRQSSILRVNDRARIVAGAGCCPSTKFHGGIMIGTLSRSLAALITIAVAMPALAQVAVPAPGQSARIDAIKKAGVLRVGVLANAPWLVENTKG